MIRIAFLAHEKETKDICFQLAKLFDQTDWVFRHYWKASHLAKAMKEETFQIFIFDELFKTPRLESVFVHDNPDALFVYVCQNPAQVKENDKRERIFYIGKENLSADLERVAPTLLAQSKQSEVYALVYDGVHVNLPYQDIFYLEKEEKMVYFHTRKGTFHKRINMSDLEEIFAPYPCVLFGQPQTHSPVAQR
jgi:hypothetical protein